MEIKKNELEQLQSKLLITKGKKLADGEIEAVLSTDDLDRHGERVSIAGLEIPKSQVFKMYYNHETYGDALPIGKWLKIWKSNGKLMGHGLFDLEDDFAYKIYRKVLGGYIDSISIGFRAKEYDGETSTWTKSTLVEASIVAEPANTEAKITNKDLGFTQEEFTQSLKVKLKEANVKIEPDDADPPEELTPPVVDEEVEVKLLNKGAVEDILTSPKKWELMEPFYDVTYAFSQAFYKEDTDVSDFSKLLKETISILETIANGTYDLTKSASGANGASEDTEMKTVTDELKSRVGALEAAVKASNESPAIKQLIQVRLAAKQVDKAAEEVNKVLKVKLKGTN